MYRFLWYHTKNISKQTVKKTGHLLFPWIIHFLTDKYKDKHHHLIVDTIFSLIIIVLIATNIGLGYWFYLFTTPADLNVEIGTSYYIISGSEITYYIDYHNTTKDLKNVSVQIISPPGFSPDNNQKNFNLGDIDKYEFGTLKITGDIIGKVGEVQKIDAIITYYFHNQKFQEIVSNKYEIKDTSFEVVTEMPENILNNQEFTWAVHFKNNSDLERQNVILNVDLPETFILTDYPENYNPETKEINIKTAKPRQAKTLEFKGIFSKAVGESNTLISVTTNFSLDQSLYEQSRNDRSIRVLTPRINIASGVNSIVSIGQSFIYTINVSNIGDAILNNVQVTANVDQVSDLGLYLYAKNGTVSGSLANWTIDSLGVGITQPVYLTITTPSTLRKQNLSLNMSASATAGIEDISVVTYSHTTAASTKFNSTLDFETEAKYYGPAGEQLGYGPFPLEAGEITALRVFWNVRDFTNDLHNVTIQTTLPSQVEWTGSTAVSQGANISYDPGSRTVTWHTSFIPAFAGPQGASFEVRVWPNSQQIGQFVNVTNETRFSALDSFTNSVMTKNYGSIRTKDRIKEYTE